MSSGFVQNALHSHHAQDVFSAFFYRSRGSTAASWPGRTPRSPSVHSEARRPLASKGPPDGLRAAHGLLAELLHMLGVVPLRRVVGGMGAVLEGMGAVLEGFWGHGLCRMEAVEGKNK